MFGTADCEGTNDFPNTESILALRAGDGSVAWSFRPTRPDHGCDFDFGASVNVGLDSSGHATFLGDGGKDGVYYSLDPTDGHLRWSTKVVFGGSDGGFIGTAAYDGTRIYATTAFGDEGGGSPKACAPGNPNDVQMENPAAHALDASTGNVALAGRERPVLRSDHCRRRHDLQRAGAAHGGRRPRRTRPAR